MPRSLRSTAKGLAQKALGRSDVRGFVRTQQLWLTKKLYRQPVSVAALRQQLVDAGVTRGRTIWVQSSWNQFFNVPLKPSDVIDLLLGLVGPQGTLAMPAFPIDQDPAKLFLVDRAPVYTGLLCEMFRRYEDVRRSIHLTSSVSAIGLNAEYLVKDHHLTAMPWGIDSPFCRLMDVDARIVGLGAGFEFITPLHSVECLLYDEVPFFRRVFDGTICYRWKRSNGETGEHRFMRRIGKIRPALLRRSFGPDLIMEARLSNLKIIAADAKPFMQHAVALGRRGITMYVQPAPRAELFVPEQGAAR